MYLSHKKHLHTVRYAVLVVVLLMLVTIPRGSARALGGSQAFNVAGGGAQPGMLMSLGRDSKTVQPATDKNSSLLVGVLTDTDLALDAQPGQVSVQTDGVTTALASTLDGDIHSGDHIAPSALQGVGARLNGAGWAVGTAQAGLNSSTPGAVATLVTDSHGGHRTVYVARIPVLVKVMYYGAAATATPSTHVPQVLQNIANAIAGKHASLLALLLGFALMLVGIFVAGFIITTAVQGGLAAIARQPLTKALILPRMLQAVAIGVGLLLASIAAAFVLLRVL